MMERPYVIAFLIGALLVLLRRWRLRGRQALLRFARHTLSASDEGRVIGRVAALNVFPGKSCQGVSQSSSEVGRDGLDGDRLVMVISAHSKAPVTQRMRPELARIRVAVADSRVVTLTAPDETGLAPLVVEVPLEEESGATAFQVDLHGLKAPCVDLGDSEAAWVTKFLGGSSGKATYRLVAICGRHRRRVHTSVARPLMRNSASFDGTRLADLAPISFTSTASLAALNEQIPGASVPMSRFRANIVMEPIDADMAFVEDHCSAIQIGDLQLRVIGPTFRCIMPAIDQETGARDWKRVKNAEPVATLKRLRSGGLRFGLTGLLPHTLGGSSGLAPLFGVYLGLANEQTNPATIKVGDTIKIMGANRRGATSYILNAIQDLIEPNAAAPW